MRPWHHPGGRSWVIGWGNAGGRGLDILTRIQVNKGLTRSYQDKPYDDFWGIKRLWAYVLVDSIQQLLGERTGNPQHYGPFGDTSQDKGQAFEWLHTDTCELVCEVLHISYHAMLTSVLQAMKNKTLRIVILDNLQTFRKEDTPYSGHGAAEVIHWDW